MSVILGFKKNTMKGICNFQSTNGIDFVLEHGAQDLSDGSICNSHLILQMTPAWFLTKSI